LNFLSIRKSLKIKDIAVLECPNIGGKVNVFLKIATDYIKKNINLG